MGARRLVASAHSLVFLGECVGQVHGLRMAQPEHDQLRTSVIRSEPRLRVMLVG